MAPGNRRLTERFATRPDKCPTAAHGVSRRGSGQGDWDMVQNFEAEQFALLDVSTNADQMVFSFAWFNDRALSDHDLVSLSDYKPVEGNQQQEFPCSCSVSPVGAEPICARSTLPQISWEPLFNLTPRPAGSSTPFGWNLHPNDGGPT